MDWPHRCAWITDTSVLIDELRVRICFIAYKRGIGEQRQTQRLHWSQQLQMPESKVIRGNCLHFRLYGGRRTIVHTAYLSSSEDFHSLPPSPRLAEINNCRTWSNFTVLFNHKHAFEPVHPIHQGGDGGIYIYSHRVEEIRNLCPLSDCRRCLCFSTLEVLAHPLSV